MCDLNTVYQAIGVFQALANACTDPRVLQFLSLIDEVSQPNLKDLCNNAQSLYLEGKITRQQYLQILDALAPMGKEPQAYRISENRNIPYWQAANELSLADSLIKGLFG